MSPEEVGALVYHGCSYNAHESRGFGLRSLCWKILLAYLPKIRSEWLRAISNVDLVLVSVLGSCMSKKMVGHLMNIPISKSISLVLFYPLLPLGVNGRAGESDTDNPTMPSFKR